MANNKDTEGIQKILIRYKENEKSMRHLEMEIR